MLGRRVLGTDLNKNGMKGEKDVAKYMKRLDLVQRSEREGDGRTANLLY
jgi:hypothetical protein